MNTRTCVPVRESTTAEDKYIKRAVRKQVKNALVKLLGKALIEDMRGKEPGMIISDKEESMSDSLNLYGFLINSVTKNKDLIVGARTEYFQDGRLVFYTVEDNDLFKTFPAAGVYQGPYKTNKPVFVEVCARIDDMYLCKAADKLRYVELMSQTKDKK